jgi:hypothetical protein
VGNGEPKPGEHGSVNWLSWHEKAAIRSRILREMDLDSLKLTNKQLKEVQTILANKEYIMPVATLNPFNNRLFDIMYDMQINNDEDFKAKLSHSGIPSWAKQTLGVLALVGAGMYLASTLDFAGTSLMVSQSTTITGMGAIASYAATVGGINVLEAVTLGFVFPALNYIKQLFSLSKEKLKDAGMGEVAKSLDKIQSRLEVLKPDSFEATKLSQITTLKDVKEIKKELSKWDIDSLQLDSLSDLKEQIKAAMRANPQGYNLHQNLTTSKLMTLPEAFTDYLSTIPEKQREDVVEKTRVSILSDLIDENIGFTMDNRDMWRNLVHSFDDSNEAVAYKENMKNKPSAPKP